MGQRRRFTPEFKRQAVLLLNAGQQPAAEIARELGIPRNSLYNCGRLKRVGSGTRARAAYSYRRPGGRRVSLAWLIRKA